MRPQSAKPKHGYWGQSSCDDINSNQARKREVKILKPDLTSHDFSRILPKKIYQDKERLYSQTLQLKQMMNEVKDENTRLKTKIAILQKQKEKTLKWMDTSSDALTSKQNSKLNVHLVHKHAEKDGVNRNLKNLMRQMKEEIEYLKTQNHKIKKTVKYTNINQLEIQRKMLVDENSRISKMYHQMCQQFTAQDDFQKENQELRVYLEEQLNQNKALAEQNVKFENIIEELQNKLRQEIQKGQAKEKKLQKDLMLQKRKVQQSTKYVEDLRREMKILQQNIKHQQEQAKKKAPKTLVRPTSAHPYQVNKSHNFQTSQIKERKVETNISQQVKDNSQATDIKTKNQKLQAEIKQIKQKLQQSELQLQVKGFKQKSDFTKKQTKQEIIISNLDLQTKAGKFQQVNSQLIKQSASGTKRNQSQIISNSHIIPFQQKLADKKAQEEDQKYDQEFQRIQQEKKNEKDKDINTYKQEFQDEQREQIVYTKSNSKSPKKNKEENSEKKNKEDNGEKKKKKEKAKDKDKDKDKRESFKPNKKLLGQIKQLLTYRMKSQRYTFHDLQNDIKSAKLSQFTFIDLCNMFVNQPFFLTANYTKTFLNYCYGKQKIQNEEALSSDILVSKLRKIIDDFDMLEEDDEREMILRISQMTNTYPQQLEEAFQKIKNGQQTVSKNDLVEMFRKLELEQPYIELIIAELSLCSDDLQHLNYYGYFERFYNQQEQDDNAIHEEQQESQESIRHKSSHKHIKKSYEDDSEEQKGHHQRLLVPDAAQNKALNWQDDDIVSDDGRI